MFLTKNPDSKLTFDEVGFKYYFRNQSIKLNLNFYSFQKLVLIGLLVKYLCDNITTKQFPNHFIRVSKQDLLIIKGINFDYWNDLEEIKIESLSSLKSLKLKIFTLERISLRNLPALRDFEFCCFSLSTLQLQNDLIDFFGQNLKSTIETFKLDIGSFELDFSSLHKSLLIILYRNDENLNLDFIYLLYNYIKKLKIWFCNHANMIKLFSNLNFSKLEELEIFFCDITRIESKMFNGSFPMLQQLCIHVNENLKIIDHDAFSNLRELKKLYLHSNSIESIDQRTFSELVNLEYLDLSKNRLKIIDGTMFSNLKKLKRIDTYPSILINSPLINVELFICFLVLIFVIFIIFWFS